MNGVSGRTRAVTAVILALFGLLWFGWAQAGPPSWLVVPLAVGSVLSLLVAGAAIVVTARTPGALSTVDDPEVRRRYGINVGIEFAVAGVGAGVLGATGRTDWIGVWVCAVVGVHFFPMSRVLADRSLAVLGLGLLLAAGAGVALGAESTQLPITATGAAAGLCLLLAAATHLAQVRSAGRG